MILGIDGGLRTFGYGVVVPRTGRVIAAGALIQEVDDTLSKHADRERRAQVQADLVVHLIRTHGIDTLAVEEMSFAPKGSAASKIGIGMSAGVVIAISRALGLRRRTIPPKTWQRAIVPSEPGEKRSAAIDYKRVYRELEIYVDCERLLASVAPSHRSHALDGCGVGVYAALVTDELHVEREAARA